MTRIMNNGFIDHLRTQHPDTFEQIRHTLDQNRDHYQILAYCIRNRTPLPPDRMACLWADNLGLARIDMNTTLFDPAVVMRIPRDFAKKWILIPVYQLGGAITVAMADPANPALVRETETLLGAPVSPVFALKNEILDAIEIQHRSSEEIGDLARGLDASFFAGDREISTSDLKKQASTDTVIRFTDAILYMAIRENASDIHIEPLEDFVLLRYRIDGVLGERIRFARELLLPVVSRIKILSGMDITERRKPQDGRLGLDLKTQSIGFRVSTVPTINGEKTVLRVLGQARKRNIPRLEELYFSRRIYAWCKHLIHSPNGAFFITGPTGSGKTTTLFSALQTINEPGKNIMTIEDPVEYRLPGINQVQVNPAIDLGFPQILRSFLRQDPDVILVGEIRDLETAKIATEAALTGHLVFATLHTNNAIQAVTRLVEIGVEPFMVGPSLIGIVAQRLVRKLCPQCKQAYTMTEREMDELFEWQGLEPLTIYRATGCVHCNHTGYQGRLAIHEMILVDETIRKMVVGNAPIEELQKAATAAGYQSMRYDGLKKVIRGLTSLEEIERTVPDF